MSMNVGGLSSSIAWMPIPKDRLSKSEFGDQLKQAAAQASPAAAAKPAAETAEISGTQAAWDKLSERTQEVLRRLKAGGAVGKAEWMDARKDMLWSGVIDALQYAGGDPDCYTIGYSDGHGNEIFYPPYTGRCTSADVGKNHPMGEKYWDYWSAGSWIGGDMRGSSVDQLLAGLKGWKARLDGMITPNGQRYDTSPIGRDIQNTERFFHTLSGLMECC